MKRLGVGILSFLFGLFFSWLCLYTRQLISLWPLFKNSGWFHGKRQGASCFDLEHCTNVPIWIYIFLIAIIFGPAIVFTVMNSLAWERSSFKKWLKCKVAVICFFILIYFIL